MQETETVHLPALFVKKIKFNQKLSFDMPVGGRKTVPQRSFPIGEIDKRNFFKKQP